MVIAIILIVLILLSLEDNNTEVTMVLSGILVVYVLNKLGKNADKNAPVPKTAKPAKPRHSPSQSRDYNQLLSAIISFIDSNGRDFEYLFIGSVNYPQDSRLPNHGSVRLPFGYVPYQCIAVIYSNGCSICYNFFQNGRYSLSSKAMEYLSYELAQHYGGQHFPEYDDGDLRSCIIYSRSGLERYKQYRKQEKDYLNSIKRL